MHNIMCLSKQAYKTKKEALDILEHLREKYDEDEPIPNTLSVYRCPMCYLYHLGNRR